MSVIPHGSGSASLLGKRKSTVDVLGAAASVIQRAWRSRRLRQGLSKFSESLRMAPRMNPAIGKSRGYGSRETGFIDVAAADYMLDTTGSVTLLNAVPAGASVNQRVGKKIRLKSLACRGWVYNNIEATANDVAFMIVYDRRPTSAMPSVSDILVSPSSIAFNNDANSGRFQIMKREDFTLIGTLQPSEMTPTSAASADFYLNLRNLPTTYKAIGTGAIGDIEEGALYLVTVGNHTNVLDIAATARLAFRTRFVDV